MARIDAALPHEMARLRLRRLARADLDRFQAYRCDASVARYQGWSVVDDVSAAAFLEGMAAARCGMPGEWFQIAIAEKLDDLLIGDIGVCLRDDAARTAELGFTIALAAQGRGLGTEAVTGLLL